MTSEERAARTRAQYHKDLERSRALGREKQRRWRAKDPERARVAALAKKANRRAAKAQRPGRLRSGDWVAVLETYGHRCRICASEESLHMDHIVPLSKGGGSTVDNVQPLCQTCNLAKGSKLLPLL